MSKEKTAALSGLYRPLWPALALLAASCVLFMTLGANGHWDFVLPRRGMVLASLLLVAYSVGVSTLLFQTLTNNPILTPSVLVAVLGGIGYSSLPQTGKFVFELAAMVGGSLLLFQTLMRQGGRDLARMILIGVVFGILFRSLSSLLQRLLDPEEFAVAQSNTFASFNTVNAKLLGVSAVIALVSAFFLWRERYKLDVLLLGRDQAVNLGLNYRCDMLWILFWIAVLTATATALVGPVSFFGLLVVALSDRFCGSIRHSLRLPMAFLTASVLLVGGQTVFEHLLGMKAVLSVVIEFAGGLVFLWLVLRKPK